MPARSSMWIHDIHCLPLPIFPPTPMRNGGSIFCSAPPRASSTIPMRTGTTRIPSASAACASFSQADADLRQEAAAGRRRSRSASRRRAIRNSRSRRRRSASSGVAGAWQAPAPGCAFRSRGCRGSAASTSSVQRCATGSPARWITASAFAQAVGRRLAFHRIPGGQLDAGRQVGAGVPAQHVQRMTVRRQRLHQPPSDQSRGPR